eukprot:977719_1
MTHIDKISSNSVPEASYSNGMSSHLTQNGRESTRQARMATRSVTRQGPQSEMLRVYAAQYSDDSSQSSDSDADEVADSNDSELYCVCRQPYRKKDFMIACDRCEEWYHGKCIGISSNFSKLVEQYLCFKCAGNTGAKDGYCHMKPPVKKRRLQNPEEFMYFSETGKISHPALSTRRQSQIRDWELARAEAKIKINSTEIELNKLKEKLSDVSKLIAAVQLQVSAAPSQSDIVHFDQLQRSRTSVDQQIQQTATRLEAFRAELASIPEPSQWELEQQRMTLAAREAEQKQRAETIMAVRRKSIAALMSVVGRADLSQQLELALFNAHGARSFDWHLEAEFRRCRERTEDAPEAPLEPEYPPEPRPAAGGNAYTAHVNRALSRLNGYESVRMAYLNGKMSPDSLAQLGSKGVNEMERSWRKRRKCSEAIQAVLGKECGEKVEQALFISFGSDAGKSYTKQYRVLLANLKSNEKIVQRVKAGDLPPEHLAKMSEEQMASKELTKWRDKAQQESLKGTIMTERPEETVRKNLKNKGKLMAEEESSRSSGKVGSIDVSLPTVVSLPKPITPLNTPPKTAKHASVTGNAPKSAASTPSDIDLSAIDVSDLKPTDSTEDHSRNSMPVPTEEGSVASDSESSDDDEPLISGGRAKALSMSQSSAISIQTHSKSASSPHSGLHIPPPQSHARPPQPHARPAQSHARPPLSPPTPPYESFDEAAPLWEGAVGAFSKGEVMIKGFEVSVAQIGGPKIESLPISETTKLHVDGKIEVKRLFQYLKDTMSSSSRKTSTMFEVRPRNENRTKEYSKFCSYLQAKQRCAVFQFKEKLNFMMYFVPPDTKNVSNVFLQKHFKCEQPEGCLWAVGTFLSKESFKKSTVTAKRRSSSTSKTRASSQKSTAEKGQTINSVPIDPRQRSNSYQVSHQNHKTVIQNHSASTQFLGIPGKPNRGSSQSSQGVSQTHQVMSQNSQGVNQTHQVMSQRHQVMSQNSQGVSQSHQIIPGQMNGRAFQQHTAGTQRMEPRFKAAYRYANTGLQTNQNVQNPSQHQNVNIPGQPKPQPRRMEPRILTNPESFSGYGQNIQNRTFAPTHFQNVNAQSSVSNASRSGPVDPRRRIGSGPALHDVPRDPRKNQK